MALILFDQLQAFTPGYNGNGYIAGVAPGLLTVGGAPASRRVRVFERITGRLVAETVSAADGTYRVDGLNPDLRYMVVGIDYERRYNAAIMDNIAPAVDE